MAWRRLLVLQQTLPGIDSATPFKRNGSVPYHAAWCELPVPPPPDTVEVIQMSGRWDEAVEPTARLDRVVLA